MTEVNLADMRGKVLFLEDRDTKPYQIDRLITRLKLAGKLEGVKGVVFGEMPGCVQHEEQGYTLPEVIEELLDGYAFPILFGFPSGHTAGAFLMADLMSTNQRCPLVRFQ